MSLDLDVLFLERLESFPEAPSKDSPGEDAREIGSGDGDMRNIIKDLMRERDEWKAQAEDQTRITGNLERRIYTKETPGSNLSNDVIRRLNRLENENSRLRSENSHLKENLQAAECENVYLCDENDGKNKKLKGANKKVKKAKDVAGKEEEKAKGAVLDKQRHLASERKMKKERNDALAALEQQRKISEDLRAELEVEQSGAPHMRHTAASSDKTTVVIPIQFEMHRGDFRVLLTVLESNQMAYTENFKRWYEKWKKPKDEVRQVVGADYVDDEKKVKIYEDMVEMPDGYLETGAEHDGWRSKRSLGAVCRQAEARHNS